VAQTLYWIADALRCHPLADSQYVHEMQWSSWTIHNTGDCSAVTCEFAGTDRELLFLFLLLVCLGKSESHKYLFPVLTKTLLELVQCILAVKRQHSFMITGVLSATVVLVWALNTDMQTLFRHTQPHYQKILVGGRLIRFSSYKAMFCCDYKHCVSEIQF
jgi:hypothetical protein